MSFYGVSPFPFCADGLDFCAAVQWKKKNLENKRGKAFKAPTRPVALHLCRLPTSAASLELGLEDFFFE